MALSAKVGQHLTGQRREHHPGSEVLHPTGELLPRWLVSFAAWRSASFLIVSGECL